MIVDKSGSALWGLNLNHLDHTLILWLGWISIGTLVVKGLK